MKDILTSPYMSLTCAVLNGAFAVNALCLGNWLMFLLCSGFAAYCFNNYMKK